MCATHLRNCMLKPCNKDPYRLKAKKAILGDDDQMKGNWAVDTMTCVRVPDSTNWLCVLMTRDFHVFIFTNLFS